MITLEPTPLKILQRQISWPVLLLFVMVVGSALAMTYVAHLNRQAFHQLQTELMIDNDLQEEWGQLLLQHSTLIDPGRVDAIARQQLDMDVPKPSQLGVVKP